MKVAFSDLPAPVQLHVKKILAHNAEMRPTAVIVGGVAALGVVTAPLLLCIPCAEIRKETLKALPELLIPFFAGAFLIDAHGIQIRRDYLRLYRSLRDSSSNPSINTLLKKFPFLGVDIFGNLVGKRHAPKFFVPIGRRVVPSPFNPGAFATWKTKYLPSGAGRLRRRAAKAN
jgi:hypothetical protein